MNKPKVVVTRRVFPETLAFLEQHAEVLSHQDDQLSAATLTAQLADAEGLLCALTNSITAELLAAAPKLRVVSNIAVGYNNIDVAACSQRGIQVTNTPGVLDDSTADLAFALILATARRVTEMEAKLRAGLWQGWFLDQWLGVDVHHAKLGIVGMGRVGQALAKRAAGFDMQVLYHNRQRLDVTKEKALGATYLPLPELLQQADFVVLQVPYSAATHHLIGAQEIALMKPNAVLINTARGGVVDDSALVEALKKNHIRGAGLDVFEGEPQLHPGFLELQNVVLTPHIGSSTETTRRAMAQLAAENLITALSGKVPPNLVNP